MEIGLTSFANFSLIISKLIFRMERWRSTKKPVVSKAKGVLWFFFLHDIEIYFV